MRERIEEKLQGEEDGEKKEEKGEWIQRESIPEKRKPNRWRKRVNKGDVGK